MNRRSDTPECVLLRRLFQEGRELTHHKASILLGITPRNTREYLKLLHLDNYVVIVEYRKDKRGPALPVYALNDNKMRDAPYPARIDSKLRMRIIRSINKQMLLLGVTE